MAFAPKAEKARDLTPDEMVAAHELAMLEARKVAMTPARVAEMESEREIAKQAVVEASKPIELKPGTAIKVHISGWAYDDKPAEVVSDNISDLAPRTITARRMRRGGDEERVTVRFENGG